MSEEENFIEFTPIQKRLLAETQNRIGRIMSEAMGMIYEELGITEDQKKNPMKYVLNNDLTGLIVVDEKLKPENKEPPKIP